MTVGGDALAEPTVSDSDYPVLFRTADDVSKRGQQRYVRLTQLELLLLVFAVAFGAVAGVTLTGATWAAAVSASLLIAAAIVRTTNRSNQPESSWFEGRAVAESVKTLAWKYMARVDPFDVPDALSDALFVSTLRDVLGERLMTGSVHHATGSPLRQITTRMRGVRALPFEARKATYLRSRLGDQLDWYTRRSSERQRAGDRWFAAGIVFETLALASALLLIVSPNTINLIGLFSTATAVVATLSRLRGDREVAQRYGLAAQELSLLQERIEQSEEAAFDGCVQEAEAAISREHKMWVARSR